MLRRCSYRRGAQLRWLGEFRGFVGRFMHGLLAHPYMAFQMGMNEVGSALRGALASVGIAQRA